MSFAKDVFLSLSASRTTASGSIRTLFLLPFGFKSPVWYDGVAPAFAGAGNGIAQFWWTRSLSLAPPSSVVPFNYLSLVWATILGFAIWGDLLTPELLLGSAIVVASGLYILWRETMRRRRTAGAGSGTPLS